MSGDFKNIFVRTCPRLIMGVLLVGTLHGCDVCSVETKNVPLKKTQNHTMSESAEDRGIGLGIMAMGLVGMCTFFVSCKDDERCR